jgi:hypothetical protein
MGLANSKYIIYLKDSKGNLSPVEWPRTFYGLQEYLSFHHNYESTWFKFQESSEYAMLVHNEASFSGLVPLHKLVEPNTHIYYVILSLPLTFPVI